MTILEVVMATGIIAITGAGVISSVNYGLFIMRMARENQRATQILMERAEALRVFSWNDITNTTAGNGWNTLTNQFTDWYTPTSATGGLGAVYSGYITNFTPTLSTGYDTNMREIDITVIWSTAGVARSRTLTTFVARDGIQNYVY